MKLHKQIMTCLKIDFIVLMELLSEPNYYLKLAYSAILEGIKILLSLFMTWKNCVEIYFLSLSPHLQLTFSSPER